MLHTVGPVWNGGTKGEVELLGRCYKNTLQLAHEHNVKSIAYPCISTGIYRFPKDIAAKVSTNKITSLLLEYTSIEKVIFICFDDANYLEYKKYI